MLFRLLANGLTLCFGIWPGLELQLGTTIGGSGAGSLSIGLDNCQVLQRLGTTTELCPHLYSSLPSFLSWYNVVHLGLLNGA